MTDLPDDTVWRVGYAGDALGFVPREALEQTRRAGGMTGGESNIERAAPGERSTSTGRSGAALDQERAEIVRRADDPDAWLAAHMPDV